MDGALRIVPRLVRFTGRPPHQQFDAFMNGRDGPDVELTGADGGDHILAQHQMHLVGGRDDDPLVARQAARVADVEEPFDLLIDRADGLNLAALID